jgi:cellulose synthase/poly-beta-1,6-N-acetylglucosamine synthase-like glycosyltransferase
MSDFDLGLNFLFAQSELSLVTIFWFTLLFDIPRYFLSFGAVGLATLAARLFPSSDFRTSVPAMSLPCPRISVVIVGHNEADSLERCVRSLREQSISDLEIIVVSDGSTDRMAEVAARLVKAGLVNHAVSADLRGGKASAINLAIAAATGNLIVNADCDCSFDRFAIENIVAYFNDPNVGAVCGDIVPRNGDTTLMARFQEIEYLFTLSVGKRFGAALDQVICISGAFGAFRREALESIGAFDAGGGEDLDLSLRLRAKGWSATFAEDAICYTDVPARLWQLIRQRLRWERDAIGLRFRKNWRLMNPRSPSFRLSEAFHQWDFIAFNVIAAIIFPIYLIWLFIQYGTFALPILIAMQIGLFVIDGIMLAIACEVTSRRIFFQNLLYLFGYSIFMAYIMRGVRLWAYVDEWFLSGSRRDSYVPLKVRDLRTW